MAAKVVLFSGFVVTFLSSCQAFSLSPLALSRSDCAGHSSISVSPVFSKCVWRQPKSKGLKSNLRMQDSNPRPSPTEEFWTRPRTTNSNWGIFFDIIAKDKPIWVTGLRTGGHSFADHNEYTRLKIRTFVADAPAAGKELDEKPWTIIGQAENVTLPRIDVGDSFPVYTSIPFKTVHIPANSGRAFCIHTNKKTGLALRRNLNFDSNSMEDPFYREWVDGVSDEGEHLKIVSGLVPGEELFGKIAISEDGIRSFVGVVEYQLTEPGN